MKKLLSCILFLAVCSLNAQDILTISYDDHYIETAKDALKGNDKIKQQALKDLLKKADKELNVTPPSVTDKDKVPPSGDKRDYMTLAPYWFPDPDTKDGLPYIRKDGERNPEIYDYKERESIKKMGSGALDCAVAYYFTGDEKYAKKSADFIYTWFLDPKKGMNPNFNYAQAIRGRNEGRGAGLIEARVFIMVMNAAKLIEDSKSWSVLDKKALQRWFEEFLMWMETSKIGLDEMKTQNNHGTYYDALRVAICLYTDQFERAEDIIETSVFNRIYNQQTEKGEMPLELQRTMAMHYTTFNLEAMILIATMGEKVGVDVYNYVDEKGRSLKKYIDFMLPYYTQEKPWPYQEIKAFNFSRAATILYIAGDKMHNPDYIKAADKIEKGKPKSIEQLLGQQSISH